MYDRSRPLPLMCIFSRKPLYANTLPFDQELLGPTKRIKTFLRLIKSVKTWSDTRGAKQVLVHVTTGSNLKATDRLLRRSCATLIGGGYVV